MRSGPLLVGLVVATLALTAWQTVALTGLEPGGSAAAAGDERLDSIEARLERIEDGLDALAADVRSTARHAASARRAAPSGGASADVDADGTVGAASATSDEIEAAVAARVEETMTRLAERERYRDGDGRWKPPMTALGRVVELDEPQQDALTRIFDGARDEAYALLTTARSDGGTLLDDLVADLRRDGDQGAAWGRFVTRLATEQAPGHNRTYLAVLAERSEAIRAEIERHLRPQQVETFRELNVDVFDVKTGHDPVGAYVLERLGSGDE